MLLLRHAKSSWTDPGLSDHERPLNGRGKRAATRMGRLLLENDLVPDLIISSTARRARDTALRVAEASTADHRIRFDDLLYQSDLPTYRAILNSIDDSVQRPLLIGHNPDLENLLRALIGRYERMPTASLARVDLAIDRWQRLRFSHDHKLVDLWRPKELD